MGVLGELFPGPKISDEAGEAGDGEKFRLGPIDLENGVVTIRRTQGGGNDAAVAGTVADAGPDGDGD
ncbi:hypothetical protein GCM10009836_67960 [Pseudonocardia ailaonensis]|uniref:Uncharacterized protein n=1 Tax=Pseudonocardia ailaonensis TaxID=367279 RepID=A0ABN2NRA6_9PSEU